MVMVNKQRPYEFFRFCLVGAVNTGVDFMVFALLSNLGVLLLPAQVVSYTCGILNSFLLNRKWTFSSRRRSTGQLLRFLLLNLFTLSITYGLLVYFTDQFGWSVLVSKLLATAASLVINFTGSRLLVFV